MENVSSVFVSFPKFLLNTFPHLVFQPELGWVLSLYKASLNTVINIKLAIAFYFMSR